jgi:hypothetical protein
MLIQMKNLSLIICFFTFTFSIAQNASLSKLTIELEAGIKPEALDKSWQSRKNAWIQEVNNAKSSQEYGKLISELESYISLNVIDKKWENKRTDWSQDCLTAKAFTNAAKLLIELESFIKPEGVQDVWKSKKDIWVNALKAIK